MAVLAGLIRYWYVVVVALSLLAGGFGYMQWRNNVLLREKLDVAQIQLDVEKAARLRDIAAATKLLMAERAETERLTQQLKSLSEIQDEAGKEYLRTPVPDSVRRLLNSD
jgi:uncharacterized protein HemX